MTDNNRNMEMSDEMMMNASGGTGYENADTAMIKGIVFVNPLPDDEMYSDVWMDCEAHGLQVYEIKGEGKFAVAEPRIIPLMPGDIVYVNHIRGYYGWEILGKKDR